MKVEGRAINNYTWIVSIKQDYPNPVKICAHTNITSGFAEAVNSD